LIHGPGPIHPIRDNCSKYLKEKSGREDPENTREAFYGLELISLRSEREKGLF